MLRLYDAIICGRPPTIGKALTRQKTTTFSSLVRSHYERQEDPMKLQPLTTSSSPSYPTRQPRNAKRQRLGAHFRKVAVAVGTSALLGFAACGGSEQRTEDIPPPGTPPVTHIDHGNEPEPENTNDNSDDHTTVIPITNEDITHMAGGLRPPLPEPPPPQPEPSPTVTPITEDDPIHIAGGRRPPQVEPPPPQIEPIQPVHIDLRQPHQDQQQDQQTNQNGSDQNVDQANQENKPPERIQVRLSGIMPAPRP